MNAIEHILTIPRKTLETIGAFEGFKAETEPYLEAFFAEGIPAFLPRPAAEEDPSHKQLIPYCVLSHAGKILSYTRGKSGGEKRLHAKKSIGIGGHINPVDAQEAAITRTTYENAVLRELAEEIAIPKITSRKIVGLINDESNPVGQVHLGVVEVFELDSDQVTALEEAIGEPEFVTVEELKTNRENYEGWSQIAIDHIENILPMQEFHFSCGDSSTGPIGFCASVKAHSKEQALAQLAKAIPESIEARKDIFDAEGLGVDYLNIYINSDWVTTADIEPTED